MMQFVCFVNRNVKIFLRDKGAVFFSLISMFVVICLMLFFLEDVNVSFLTENLALIPGRDFAEDEKNSKLLVLLWAAAGIIPVNAVMVTLSNLSAMIKDKANDKSKAIYSSPVNRFSVAFSYIIAACISSVIICELTFLLSEVYICFKGGDIFSFKTHIAIFIIILVNSLVYSAIMYLFAVLIKSEGAWSGMGTVLGALVGFLGGIYMPIGSLAKSLQTVLKCTPVIYSTSLFRQIMTEEMIGKVFRGADAEIVSAYKNEMGITIDLFNENVSAAACLGILIICGMLFLIAGTIFTNRKTGAK